jgi:16S rRNA G527 N7-methylase RsmG
VVVSRALSSLENYIRLAIPLLAQEGIVIALKGEIDLKEPSDLQSLFDGSAFGLPSNQSLSPPLVDTYQLPHLNAKRSILIIKRKGIEF